MLTVSLNEILTFVKSTAASRNIKEGEQVINSKLIIEVGNTDLTENRADIFGLCQSTSALNSHAHAINGKLVFVQNEARIKSMDCTCKAGSGHACKHIVAILLFYNRNDIREIEMLSCTDVKCIWNQQKGPISEAFQALPMETFCCYKQDPLPFLSEEDTAEVRRSLANCDETSALRKHMVRIRLLPALNVLVSEELNTTSTEMSVCTVLNNACNSLEMKFLENVPVNIQACCDDFYSKNLACASVKEVERRTRDSTHEWKKERQFRVTGSRCYPLFTYSEKKDWELKSIKYFWPSNISPTEHMKRGIQYEPVARDLYEASLGDDTRIQQCGLIVAKDNAWLAYSPDGVLIKDNEAIALLEIKCPNVDDTKENTLQSKCRFLQSVNGQLTVRKKNAYYAQVQLGMAVLNLRETRFVLYSSKSNTFYVIIVMFDKEYARNLLGKVKTNYFERMIHIVCKYKR